MKLIPLTRGNFAMVDDVDFDRVNQFKWFVNKYKKGIPTYAMRWEKKGVLWKDGQRAVWMHNFILGVGNYQLDHKDGNGLNNQRLNLRPATSLQNTKNKAMQSRNTSGFKGVIKHNNGWVAWITANGKPEYLGYSKDPKIVAALYDVAAIKKFGEFARTNQILGLI